MASDRGLEDIRLPVSQRRFHYDLYVTLELMIFLHVFMHSESRIIDNGTGAPAGWNWILSLSVPMIVSAFSSLNCSTASLLPVPLPASTLRVILLKKLKMQGTARYLLYKAPLTQHNQCRRGERHPHECDGHWSARLCNRHTLPLLHARSKHSLCFGCAAAICPNICLSSRQRRKHLHDCHRRYWSRYGLSDFDAIRPVNL